MDPMAPRDGSSERTRRPKLGDKVRERLLGMLDAGDFAPGDVFPSERELMARFAVGRPAVREAMQALQAMGLLDVRHGERPRVARPTVAGALDRIGLTMRHALTHSDPMLEDLKEVRIATEGHLARIAARRRTSEDVSALHAVVTAQERAAGRDAATFTRLDGEFHATVAGISGNPVLASVVEAVFDWLSEFHVSAVHRPGLEELTIREHREIVNAIETGRVAASHRAMSRHLNRANALYHCRNRVSDAPEVMR